MQGIGQMTTKTEEIFKTNGCPYDNYSQGSSPRVTFVCSAGMLRSPTAARIAGNYGINARSAGSNPAYALILLSANLIRWSNFVVFMHNRNYFEFKDLIQASGNGILLEEFLEKSICWSIEDDYNYMDESLVWKIEKNIEQTFERTK